MHLQRGGERRLGLSRAFYQNEVPCSNAPVQGSCGWAKEPLSISYGTTLAHISYAFHIHAWVGWVGEIYGLMDEIIKFEPLNQF